MNRTDRLLAIVLELQARGHARAEDLARTFEVSKRTVYRDITALSEAKVPIIASPGSGYRLMDGYFLPPLTFTPDEAAILVLGVQAVRHTVDAPFRDAVLTALRKLEVVLPPEARRQVQALHETMRIVGGWASTEDADKLGRLRDAVLERRVVRLRYHSPRYDQPSERDVEPYALLHYRDVWHLTGFCRLRGDMREFRLDRIDALATLDQHFERDADRSDQLRVRNRGGALEVRVRVAERMLRWVRAERHWSFKHEEPAGVLIFAVEQPADILPWLLRWGTAVEVLSPEAVRDALIEELRQLSNIYSIVAHR